ncbi:MAG: TorF family putative porin [Gammaproteobacteria bacterium]|nr:TorF family putative porin [Gammaproteobacteria bacterium]MDH5630972.1 TorF family putative porin [Gammaproteobacteria bacterium]
MQTILKGIFLLLLALPINTFAETFKQSSDIKLVSQYVWRGVDLNTEEAAIQGQYHLQSDFGLWFNLWGSNYDFGLDDGVQIDLSAGFKIPLDKSLFINLGIKEYTYTGSTESSTEYFVTFGGIPLGGFSTDFSYANDKDRETDYLAVDATHKINSNFSLALHYGYTDSIPENYSDVAIGIDFNLDSRLKLSAKFTNNSRNTLNDEDYFIISMRYAF